MISFLGQFTFQMVIFPNIALFVGWVCTLPREQIDGSQFDHQIYTAHQKFGITSVNWSTCGDTATQMSISSKILHGIF